MLRYDYGRCRGSSFTRQVERNISMDLGTCTLQAYVNCNRYVSQFFQSSDV